MTDHFPPGPEGNSWVAAFEQDRLQAFQQAQRKYGPLVHFQIGAKRHMFLVTDPEYVEYVLIDHPEKFNRGLMYKRRSRKIGYAGRAASAATATGVMSQHLNQLKALLDEALR